MKPVCIFLLFLSAVLTVRNSDGARILAIFPLDVPSHFVMYVEILKGLLAKGHRIDVVSHFNVNNHENYTNVVDLSGKGPFTADDDNFATPESISSKSIEYLATYYGNDACNLLDLPDMQNLIKNPPNDPPYDLVIAELLFANCFLAFGRHLKVPVVAITSGVTPYYMNEPLGNPANPAIVPEHNDGLISYMNFWQRLKNTVFTWWNGSRVRRATEVQNEIVKKHFGTEMPGIRELERDVSLLLVNSHYTLNGARPFTPAVVEVGGVHVRSDIGKMPEELKDWLDNSDAGCVYVSFGSSLKVEAFPKEILAELYAAFEKLSPIRVLLKSSNPDQLPDNLPENVLAFKWITQEKVLQHKNTRAFVTHGGTMGVQEAVTFGVPFVGIPFFSDQPRNVRNCADKEVAVYLDYANLNADNFLNAVKTVIEDPKYRRNMIALSKKFLNRPRSSRDTAVFWIEYIMKYGGDSLRSPAVQLYWWQLALLDVYGSIILAFVFLLLFSKLLLSLLVRRLLKTDTILPTTKKMV